MFHKDDKTTNDKKIINDKLSYFELRKCISLHKIIFWNPFPHIDDVNQIAKCINIWRNKGRNLREGSLAIVAVSDRSEIILEMWNWPIMSTSE